MASVSRVLVPLTRPLAHLPLVALLAAPAIAGNVLVVDMNGSGPFLDVQQAIDAAVDGDTILVKAGTYPSFVVGNKSLAIVGDAGHDVQIHGAIRARNLGEGKTLLLSRLKSTGTRTPNTVLPYGIYLNDNAGSVRVESCELTGTDASGADPDGWDGAFVADSADTAFRSCTMRGGFGRFGYIGSTEPGTGGEGLSVSSSTVSLHDCEVLGGHGQDGTAGGCCCWDGGSGGHGCESTSSTLLISDSTLVGGSGGDGYQQFCTGYQWGGTGGVGLRMAPSTANTAYVQGGVQQGGMHGCDVGGLCHTYCYGNAQARNGTTIVDLASPPRTLLAPNPIREHVPAVLTFLGASGDRVGLFVSSGTQSLYVPTWEGMLLLRTRFPQFAMYVGVLPPSGSMNFTLPLGPLPPGVQAGVYHLQAVFVDAQGLRRLGSASSVVVLDSAF